MRKKTRKQTIPKKKSLRVMADRLWSKAVKGDWCDRCAVCGNTVYLNSHHLIPRKSEATRYELRNGVCLCSHCHVFSNDISPHLNAPGWMVWLSGHWPRLHDWCIEIVTSGYHRRSVGTTNAAYFCDVIRGLREYVEEDDFDRIVGIRFSAWLLAEEKESTDG